MTNMNLENGMKKLRRKDLLDEALEMARGAYEMYGPSDTITVRRLYEISESRMICIPLDDSRIDWGSLDEG